MAILIVMSGIPGSGKSTYIARNKNVEDAVVSRDAVRAQVASKYPIADNYSLHEKEVYKKFIQQINEAGLSHEVVWADATHLTRKSLNRLFSNVKMKEFQKVEIICIETSLEKALARNAQRSGKARVPNERIKEMHKSYRRPKVSDFPKFNIEVKIIKED